MLTSNSKDIVEKTRKNSVKLLINGQQVESLTQEWRDVLNPATQEVLAKVPMATEKEVHCAVAAAKEAFYDWKEIPITQRIGLLLGLHARILEEQELLSLCITREQGKPLTDARREVRRALDLLEYAVGAPTLMLGDTFENVAPNVDIYSIHQPLGVCAGITPFNYPVLAPFWFFPLALVAGNTFVLKPSEYTPMSMMLVASWMQEVGFPSGVFNIVHGNAEVVHTLCEHEAVRTVSFVGATSSGEAVHARATSHGKRCQALLSAKNQAIILPDAHRERTLSSLVGAAFGVSGQRCMSISSAYFVGESREWIPDLIQKAKNLSIGPGEHKGVVIGPVSTAALRNRIDHAIDTAISAGAKLLLDGRRIRIPGFEEGNFLGPTILENVPNKQAIAREEVLGPVLCVFTAETMEQAIHWINDSPQNNAAVLFTHSGPAAHYFQRHVQAGMIGINLPIPTPLPFFSYSSGSAATRTQLHPQGKDAIRFFTQLKTVTARWVYGPSL